MHPTNCLEVLRRRTAEMESTNSNTSYKSDRQFINGRATGKAVWQEVTSTSAQAIKEWQTTTPIIVISDTSRDELPSASEVKSIGCFRNSHSDLAAVPRQFQRFAYRFLAEKVFSSSLSHFFLAFQFAREWKCTELLCAICSPDKKAFVAIGFWIHSGLESSYPLRHSNRAASLDSFHHD
jgi:hypothetical protein